MRQHLFEEILEIFVWLQSVGFGCFCYTVENGACSGSTPGAYDVLAVLAHAEFSDAPFCVIVIQWDDWIIQKCSQVWFLI